MISPAGSKTTPVLNICFPSLSRKLPIWNYRNTHRIENLLLNCYPERLFLEKTEFDYYRTAVLQRDISKRPHSCSAAGLFAGTPLQPLLSAELEEGHLPAAEFEWGIRKQKKYQCDPVDILTCVFSLLTYLKKTGKATKKATQIIYSTPLIWV